MKRSPTAYCLLPTAYCLLPTAYCLFPVPELIPLHPRISPNEPDLRCTRLPDGACLWLRRRHPRRFMADRASQSADR
ncbi:MAG: hypothetical protein E5Y06_11355 [Mesorhizobium sp.]|nr:MAG: hypothetical protein E5Y06_11355 [Mesorhizobium sp.]TJU98349.1 MAG: hypothetical protein E5Y08_12665 [Mesorhizobium sp.]TJV18932.1 MAG: hypothetical protein E5Y07_07695 [Mesorhizobium sp.]